MSSYTSISVEKLGRLIGTANAPMLIDVRTENDFKADPRLIPGAIRRSHERVAEWIPSVTGSAVIICQKGGKLAEGTAAWLRHEGLHAETLDGGFDEWKSAKLPLVPAEKLPVRNARGANSLGDTLAAEDRPHCLSLVDPPLRRSQCSFSFVAASEVAAVGERFGAVPFDIENVFWSHRGELCTFDVMIEEFGLATQPLLRLGRMVRAADTGRLDLSPEAPGLMAASLGLSRMYDDDLAQLEAGIAIYDAFYRWCRDATSETHNWPNHKARVPA